MKKTSLLKKYMEIDDALRYFFTKRYLMYLLCSLVGIIFMLTLHAWQFMLVFIAIMLCFIGILSYNCLKCLEGDILKISGRVDEIYIPHRKKVLERDYLILQTSDTKFVKVYNVKTYKAKIDNEITIYFPKNCLFSENNDSFVLHHFIYLHIDKRQFTK